MVVFKSFYVKLQKYKFYIIVMFLIFLFNTDLIKKNFANSLLGVMISMTSFFSIYFIYVNQQVSIS